jgi:hypothetical protein
MYKIEKNIKIPEETSGAMYPLHELEVGDSFFVPMSEDGRSGRRLQTAASGYMRRHPGIKLIVRTVEGGTRVWRVKFVAQEAQ